MKKNILSICLLASTTLLAGCGATAQSILGSTMGANNTGTTTTTTDTGSAVGSVLESFLGAVLGNTTLKQSDILGTWNYTSADCVFETENLLMKAGGEVAAAQIEAKLNETLAKVGIQTGTCNFVFNSDNTYTATISGFPVNGEYLLDAENKKLTMTYLSGLATMTPNVVKNGNTISLLYEADKLLAIAQRMAAMSGNTGLQSLAELAKSYDGLMIGLELKK